MEQEDMLPVPGFVQKGLWALPRRRCLFAPFFRADVPNPWCATTKTIPTERRQTKAPVGRGLHRDKNSLNGGAGLLARTLLFLIFCFFEPRTCKGGRTFVHNGILKASEVRAKAETTGKQISPKPATLLDLVPWMLWIPLHHLGRT